MPEWLTKFVLNVKTIAKGCFHKKKPINTGKNQFCPIFGIKQNLKFPTLSKFYFRKEPYFQFELFFKKSMEPLAPFWNEFFNNPIAT
jgi:hypothetical protein